MKVRKLEPFEHPKTRPLWEVVFPEDTKQFLDYYYFIKARENEIYVIEEDDAIRSMIQLNPYTITLGGHSFPARYIIAVATQEEYRGRGYMRRLLQRTMQEMYDEKMPITFLMPAAEAIYAPHDFRFVYEQLQMTLCGKESHLPIEEIDATLFDAEEIAQFFHSHFAQQFQVYAQRDAAYYQTRILEQQSENGGIRLLREKGKLVGMFFYAKGEAYEILEPLFLPAYEKAFLQAVAHVVGDKETVRVLASPTTLECFAQEIQKKPLIMFRILHLETLLKSIRLKENVTISCSFGVLDPILTQNSRIWRLETDEDGNVIVSETEDSQGVLTIGALTDFLFGVRTLEEIKMEQDVLLTEELESQLRKIEKFAPIFLNEVV